MSVREKTKDLLEKAKVLITDIPEYWSKPREGEYVSNREFTYFIVGTGTNMVAQSVGGNLYFGAACLFVGAIYRLKMMDFIMLNLVGVVLNYFFAPIGMTITDNLGSPPKKTMRVIHIANLVFALLGIGCFFVPQEPFESFMPALPQVVGTKFLFQASCTYWNILVYRKLSPKYGKYRCWMVANTLPYILSLALVAWFPYNTLDYNTKFWVMHLFFSLNGCFSSCFGQSINIQYVISPSTSERTKIMSIGSFVYSIFPSIYNVVFPLLATLAGGLTNIRTYRLVVPIMIVCLAPFALLLAFKVHDRVIQEPDHKPQIKMLKGFKEVLRNKYLWITNVSGWIGAFSAGLINIVNMLIIYALRKDWLMGVVSLILGPAWTPGMLLAPILIKKFGKKKITLYGRYSQFFCTFISVAGVYLNSFFLVILSTFISTMMASLLDITNKSMMADIWDYQQYISGERLDGCMGIFGYISSPFVTLAGMLVPYLYGCVGFTSDWNILYDPVLRSRILMITLIVGAVFSLLSIIPYHFYDFTERRHGEIMDELRERAKEKERLASAGEAAEAATV